MANETYRHCTVICDRLWSRSA